MTTLYVEGWAPDYGTPLEPDAGLADDEKVDETVEVAGRWDPIPGNDDGVRRIAFVDGVRRVDARLTIDDPAGPVAGLCGSYGVGAVVWDREKACSVVERAVVRRLAVFGGGRAVPVPVGGPLLAYRSESVPGDDPGALIQRFHGAMRTAEGELSETLAQEGLFVVGDGPINDLSSTEKVGYIKSHRAPYLTDERTPVVARLEPGERTPLFLIGKGGAYERYSWYLRLARLHGGHSWTGVVRVEVSAAVPVALARKIADRTAAVLPLVASVPHVDPRAPQNLVPIAALERELRRRLGDRSFVYRALREAVTRSREPAA
ncbi:MAG: DNA double-strand break repair nuclease NurA [Acidimicrobiia bacterium]